MSTPSAPPVPAGRRRTTAYHEAGHAAWATLSGIGVRSATIRLTDDYDGCVYRHRRTVPRDLDAGPRFDRHRWERELILNLAGPMAGKAAGGRLSKWYAPGTDFYLALGLARRASECDAEVNAWLTYLWHRTINELVAPAAWPAVVSIAHALLARETLTGAEVRDAYYGGAQRTDIENEDVLALNARMHRVRCPFLFVGRPPPE